MKPNWYAVALVVVCIAAATTLAALGRAEAAVVLAMIGQAFQALMPSVFKTEQKS